MKETRNIWNHLHCVFLAFRDTSKLWKQATQQSTTHKHCILRTAKEIPLTRKRTVCVVTSPGVCWPNRCTAQRIGLVMTCVTFTGDFSLWLQSQDVPSLQLRVTTAFHDSHHLRKPKMAISCFKRFQAQLWGLQVRGRTTRSQIIALQHFSQTLSKGSSGPLWEKHHSRTGKMSRWLCRA